MAQGRTTALILTLPPADRATLEGWQRRTTIESRYALRGRLVLLVAAGATITQAAARAGLSRNKAYKWLHRYQAQGLDGLRDKVGRGKRRSKGA